MKITSKAQVTLGEPETVINFELHDAVILGDRYGKITGNINIVIPQGTTTQHPSPFQDGQEVEITIGE